jgi:glyoxylase-like metal-dependent hydrolase (beta-lactamase superfamily II)
MKKTTGQQRGKLLRSNQSSESGRVVEYHLGHRRRLFQITTFCPGVLGPGPTNLYLIEDDALILVDTGLPTNMAKRLFYFWRNQPMPTFVKTLPDDYSEQELLSAIELTGHDIKEIRYLILTHGHIDHYFLGKKIVEVSGAKVVAHVSDSDNISNPWTLVKLLFDKWPMLIAMGVPQPKPRDRSKETDEIATIDFSLYIDTPLMLDGPLKLRGIKPNTLSVRHFPGHSPGSISILIHHDESEEAFMLCGDTLLYPITPHPDDLIAYLRTLKKMRELNNISLVLPAHGKAISKIQQRLDALERHHRYRLKLTYEACKTPKSIWQIATIPKYFDVYVDPAKFNPLAGQEAMVHAELLQLASGLLQSHVEGMVHYFQNSGEPFEEVYDRVQKIVNDEHSTLLLRR